MSNPIRRGSVPAFLLCLALCAFAAPAALASSYQPNDSVLQAAGPLSGGTDYDAAIDTDNDPDYFYFNTNGQRQIDISMIELSGSCYSLSLYTSEGEFVDDTDDAIGGTTFASCIPRRARCSTSSDPGAGPAAPTACGSSRRMRSRPPRRASSRSWAPPTTPTTPSESSSTGG